MVACPVERPPRNPRSGFLQLLTPGASPDNSKDSVSEPQLVGEFYEGEAAE
jgi:hypothetical protein